MIYALIALLLAPAITSVVFGFYSITRWLISRRGASRKSELLVGVLGHFSLFFPRLMNEQSKLHFTRFLLSMCFFIAYVALLPLLFRK
jgi:hypothetical protein